MVQLFHFPQELPEDLCVWTHFQSLSNFCQTLVSGREMDCILPSLQWRERRGRGERERREGKREKEGEGRGEEEGGERGKEEGKERGRGGERRGEEGRGGRKKERRGGEERRGEGEEEVVHVNTVKPPNRGHFGDGPFVPCREVVLFSEVLF